MAKTKTLIIGAANNYDWDKLKYWVNSINASGYTGDVTLVATNISGETIQKLTENGVSVSAYGNKTDDGGFRNNSPNSPHVERFFWIWNTLKGLDYEQVIVTDTRDVIFQSDPEQLVEYYLDHRLFLASSEGLQYKNEPWGLGNIRDTFGPFFTKDLEEALIMNVGVLAGRKSYVQDMLLMIFQMSLGRPIPITDQAVYNFLINTKPWDDWVFRLGNDVAWAVQLGTTKEAVKAGAGDLGKAGNYDKYLENYVDVQPFIKDGRVYVSEGGLPFAIVHQWDRIPELKAAVEERYA